MPKKIDLSGDNNPNLTITEQELQAMINRYKTERFVRLVPNYIVSDSRAVWLEKSAIDLFFQENPGSTGLRFYFGVIDDINHPDGAHNIIIVATDTNGNDNIDRIGNLDAVIVTKTFDIAFMGKSKSAVCPPPNRPCQGNKLTY